MPLKHINKAIHSTDFTSLVTMSSSRIPEHRALIAHSLEALGFVQTDAHYQPGQNTYAPEAPIDPSVLELSYTFDLQAVHHLLGTRNCWTSVDGNCRTAFSNVKLARQGSWTRMWLTACPM